MSWVRGVCVGLLLLIPACSSQPGYEVRHSRPPSAELRARMGRTCLRVPEDAPRIVVREPDRRAPAGVAGFFIGGGGGFAVGAVATAAAGPLAPLAAVTVLPTTTVAGALIGAFGGATMGGPTKEDKASGDGLRKTAGGLDLRRIVRDEAGAWAEATESRHLRRQEIQDNREGTVVPASNSASSMLEMKVVGCGVRIKKDRQAQVYLGLETRLVDSASKREVYRSVLEHLSEARPFEQWAERDSALLREELETGCRRLVRQSADEVFVK